MPFVDLEQIRWSEEFVPGNKDKKSNQLPNEDQILALKNSEKHVLENLKLTNIGFGNLVEFNFSLSNLMMTNNQPKKQLLENYSLSFEIHKVEIF